MADFGFGTRQDVLPGFSGFFHRYYFDGCNLQTLRMINTTSSEPPVFGSIVRASETGWYVSALKQKWTAPATKTNRFFNQKKRIVLPRKTSEKGYATFGL